VRVAGGASAAILSPGPGGGPKVSTMATLSPDLDAQDAELVRRAWARFGLPGTPAAIVDISATVSTNRVYRVCFERGHEVIAKTSSYGSYVHFRQDHQLIQQWRRLLGGTRFSDFLAPILGPAGGVYTYREAGRWVVFYQK